MTSRVEPWAILDIDPERVRRIVRQAIEEDVGARDATTEATVEAEARATGIFVAKQAFVVAGLDVALEVFRAGPGDRVGDAGPRGRPFSGNAIASVAAARGILTGERWP
jgi:nicotinate-nucleotide pyrophosphorylase (carboxylating)